MGSVQDIMRGFINKEIQAKFPHHDGWNMEFITSKENQGFVFRVSRNFRGQNRYAFLAASLKQKPSAD